jgi:hypothetical protein
MRGWMGLTADEDVSLDSFIRMLERLKKQLKTSVHDQECVTPCDLLFESLHQSTIVPFNWSRRATMQTDYRVDVVFCRHAVTDPLSMLYYPFTAECYWWSIVLLLRPTVIAIIFNARNRGTGLIQDLVDWRLVVIFVLVTYNTVHASFRPFKLHHESQLDSVCVVLLVVVFGADIQKDMSTIENNNVFLVSVLVISTSVLVLMTARGRYITKRLIK